MNTQGEYGETASHTQFEVGDDQASQQLGSAQFSGGEWLSWPYSAQTEALNWRNLWPSAKWTEHFSFLTTVGEYMCTSLCQFSFSLVVITAISGKLQLCCFMVPKKERE